MSRKDTLRRIDQGIAGAGGATVSVTLAGSGGASNADTVDGLHAAPSPQAGKLLALNSLSRFPSNVIDWSSVAGSGLVAAGNVLAVQWGAIPSTIQPDDTASGGSAATVARSDHRHAIATAAPGAIEPDASAHEGTAASFARSDHRHAIGALAPHIDLAHYSVNAEGVSESFSRADHSHGILAYSDATVYQRHLLKSDALGDLKLRRLTLSSRLIASLIVSEAGTGLTLQPIENIVLSPGTDKLVKAAPGVRLQSDGYASQTTGWAVDFSGAADFRYLYVGEMHAKAFVADLEQALAGGQIIAKSVAPLAEDFAVPAPGATTTLWVESFAGFPTASVFQDGDTVMVRTFDRTGGTLTIGNAFGTVSSPTTVPATHRQSWTFTRLSGTVGGMDAAGTLPTGTVVPAGTLALDFGVSGNGYYEVNAIDGAMGANSPYAQVVTWDAHPWYDRTVQTRYGNLKGIFNVTDEYGIFAGSGAADADQYLRMSNEGIEGHNLPIRLYDGATQVVRIEPGAAPYIGLGNPAPTGYLGASGIWLGKHSSAYKAHVGTVSGGDVAAGWKWDGSTLTVKGQIYVTGGDAAKTDLSNVGANVVSGKVNADTTLIAPGRIQVYSTMTLEDWRYANTTTIDGGAIQTGTVDATKITVNGFNECPNPGFEIGDTAPADWQMQAQGQWGNYGRNGTKGIQIVATGTTPYGAYVRVRIKPGTRYYIAGWMCYVDGTAYSNRLYAQERKADGATTLATYDLTVASPSPGVWVRRAGTTNVTHAEAYWLYIWLLGWSTTPVGHRHRWDDIVVREMTDVGVMVGDPSGARVQISPDGIEGYSDAATKQFYIMTQNGRAGFGGGKGVLDASGLVLSGAETSYYSYNAVRWLTTTYPAPGGNEVARVSAGLQYPIGGSNYPLMEVGANENRSYASSNLINRASSGTYGNYAMMSLVGSSASPQAVLAAMIGAQAAASVIVSGGPRQVSFVTNLTTRATISDTGLDVAGTVTSTGQVNMAHPHFILPVELLPSKTLTMSYQGVVWATQSWNSAFTAIAGRSYTSQTGWEMYWVVAARFQTNPTTIRAALYHYTGGSWQYHPSSYTATMYAAGINYIAWGPWPLSGVSQTMELHMRVESGSGASVGPDTGGVSYLIFRRS